MSGTSIGIMTANIIEGGQIFQIIREAPIYKVQIGDKIAKIKDLQCKNA